MGKNRTLYSLIFILIFGYILPISAQPIQPNLSNIPATLPQSSNSRPLGIEPNEKWDSVPEDIRSKNSFKAFRMVLQNKRKY